MCGLAGILTTRRSGDEPLAEAARRMADTIIHRGPDDAGTWADTAAGIAFGFRRLAILDLSPAGHQPMASASDRFVMVFNGEVYNHAGLREELRARGHAFRGHSDTEVMLAAFEQWGIAAAIPRFVGMFAMAIWDRHLRRLTLGRDRLGKKPLYVYSEPGLVSFASELKALAAGPSFDRTVDPAALTAYLRYLYVPAPGAIFSRVRKLPPGHLLEIQDADSALPAPLAYWTAEQAAAAGEASPWDRSDAEAVDALHEVLTDAVRLRVQADVPVGALLSGGIDSSMVVALMQAAAPQPVRTYTIGFDAKAHDEAAHAARVARHLGTVHTELRLTGRDALALVPRLPTLFDEPFADPSEIPTYLVSQLARREVTVALSGDGGDEVFAGYNRYVSGMTLLPRMAALPYPARRALAVALELLPSRAWDRMGSLVGVRLGGEKMSKLVRLARSGGIPAMYETLASVTDDPATLVRSGTEADHPMLRALSAPHPAGLLRRMMVADQAVYLPDDLLAKVDRASMAVSLETRTPILDHRVVEFAWRLPERLLVRGGQGKWILRELLHRYVPPALVERPKVGFTVPIVEWLRGPLHEWASDLLAGEPRNGPGTALNPAAVRRRWDAFDRGRGDLAPLVWALAVYRDWEHAWR